MSALAEITDKVASFGLTFLVHAAFALVFFALGRIRWWLSTLALLWAVLGIYLLWAELLSPRFGETLLSELGWSGVVGQHLAIATPQLAAVGASYLLHRRDQRRRRIGDGECPACGYPVAGSRCPECGRRTP